MSGFTQRKLVNVALHVVKGWCCAISPEVKLKNVGSAPSSLTESPFWWNATQVAHYQLMKCKAVRAFVQKRQYLVWPEDPQDLEWFYEKLISQIIKDTNVKRSPEDKRKAEMPENPIQAQRKDVIKLGTIRATAMWILTARVHSTPWINIMYSTNKWLCFWELITPAVRLAWRQNSYQVLLFKYFILIVGWTNMTKKLLH